MDAAAFDAIARLVSTSYASQAETALLKRRSLIKTLLSQRRLPLLGWDDASIEQILQEAALMDSNNFLGNIGVGEREARVACQLVARRHYRLAHGVGRSGDIAAVQPKAAGSSMLAKLTNILALDALRLAGLKDASAATVLPLATGMALTATLLTIKRTRPPQARYVLWPRIDQKTCAKCVTAAGLDLVVIPNQLEGDQLRTDLEQLNSQISSLGTDSIVAVLSTTSCFAPRAADRLVEIAKLCAAVKIAHVINNAYGVQICDLITSSWRKGRVDAVVQSTDKNFMVPVGGSIVAAGPGQAHTVDAVNAAYPGRASAAPMLDLLMTLLHWGVTGWQHVLQERESLWHYAQDQLGEFAAKHGCSVLATPDNPISIALALTGLEADGTAAGTSTLSEPVLQLAAGSGSSCREQEGDVDLVGGRAEGIAAIERMPSKQTKEVSEAHMHSVTFLGSMLFNRFVSGTRVVARGKHQTVEGIEFNGFGAHYDAYPSDYLTVAVALGTTREDFDKFIERLSSCWKDLKAKQEHLNKSNT